MSITPQVTLSLLYTLPAKGAWCNQSGPLLLYQTRPALRACCDKADSLFFCGKKNDLFWILKQLWTDMCGLFRNNGEDLVKVPSANCRPFLWTQCGVWGTEKMYMAWLLSWWCLPLSTCFQMYIWSLSTECSLLCFLHIIILWTLPRRSSIYRTQCIIMIMIIHLQWS